MLHFNNTIKSIHNSKRSNIFILPILILLIIGCKKEEITPSGKQITETRHPGTFKSINTNSAANIHITQSENHSVVIKGSDNLIERKYHQQWSGDLADYARTGKHCYFR